ncbi:MULTISPECIES: MATE family efflux transporter [Nostoc]|uniref:Probable multidrug resistance protein NorM n=1 Tax=Nostoc paludosum FACHB-159 TaxID=2692908 RepID=A0ABR8K3X5_9NOSO|nr:MULTISPECIES: MATE family efflux transporter [Nostoc]MBD2677486.1 MATE family efflux transporter [Nostoc sp. FACHB-857]MBD2734121.1 MATE family efflux transporter [Nostoc paludosum FACHB-159]
MTSQKQSQITNEILDGNLAQLMLKLSIPSTLGILMLSLNTFIDALFAGRFIGESALAGISLALPIIAIINGFAFCIGVGSASVLSRAIGSGDVKTQSKIFGNLIVITAVISLLITIIGYSYGGKLILLMGGTGVVALEGTKYFNTYIIGSVFLILAEGCSKLIKSEGNLKLTLIFDWLFVIVNIALNYIFISAFNWGTQGIALATVMAMVVYSIANLGYFIVGKSSIPASLKKIAIAIDLIPQILSVGISELFYPFTILLQDFVIFNSISHYGTNTDIAFYAAAGKVISIVFIPIIGFSQALQPIIGINYGAQNYGRIKKAYLTFAIIATFLLILIWLPLQLFPKMFLEILLPDVKFMNGDLLNFRIMSVLMPIWPLAYFSNTLFLSIGKGKTVLVVVLIKSIILTVPTVILFSKIAGVRGIYSGILFADILFMLLVLILTVLEFKSLSFLKVKTTKYKQF